MLISEKKLKKDSRRIYGRKGMKNVVHKR